MNPKNECKFIGRMTKDAETRSFDNGSVTNFTIAVQRNFKNKDGVYDADFIECRATNKIGETIAKFFHKGSPIIVVGDYRNNNWTDKDGNKHYGNYINITDFAFPERDSSQSQNNSTAAAPQSMPTANDAPVTGMPEGFSSIPTGADTYLPFS